MSAKGCSPGSAACEGFSGRLKNEFLHHRDRRGVALDEFGKRLGEHLEHYREGRLKKSLGWMSPTSTAGALDTPLRRSKKKPTVPIQRVSEKARERDEPDSITKDASLAASSNVDVGQRLDTLVHRSPRYHLMSTCSFSMTRLYTPKKGRIK